MTNEEAIKILKNEYMCRIKTNSCHISGKGCVGCEYNEDNSIVTQAINYAVQALSKQSASSEQVGKDIKFPTIHCCRGYDSIQDESGRMGFGVYDPQEKDIYIAGDVPKEIFLKALFHEIFHWMQNVAGMKFNEDDANSFSDILYDAVDMFDDHGPELFGQKTIVEPLPSAQPEPKTGYWIPVDSYTAFGGDEMTWLAHGNPIAYHYCSECKNHAYALEDGEDLLSDFCPNCGAKMKGE